jgi:hypothetical protein
MASKIFFLLMCAILVERSNGLVLRAKDCGSELGEFSSLDIDCDEGSSAELCELSKGKTYTGHVKFTPNTMITNATIALHAKVGPATLPFPLPDNDLCKGKELTCPLKENVEVTAAMNISVPSYAPAISIVAKIEFQSGGKDLVCAEFLGKIHS